MHQISLSEISFEDALERLALRKEALDAGEVEALPSEVLSQTDIFGAIGRRVAEKIATQKRAFDPNLGQALALAGGGALLGGVGGLATARPGRRSWRSALEGAAAGAVLGGGASLVDQAAGLGLGAMGSKALDTAQKMAPSPVARSIGAVRDGVNRTSEALKFPTTPSQQESGSELDKAMAGLDVKTQQQIAAALKSRETGWLPSWREYAGTSGALSIGGAVRELRNNPAIDPTKLREILKREVLLPWRQRIEQGGKALTDTDTMTSLAQFRDTIENMAGLAKRRSSRAWSRGFNNLTPVGPAGIDNTAWMADILTPSKQNANLFTNSRIGRMFGNSTPRAELLQATNKVNTVDKVKQLLRHTPAGKDADVLADAAKASRLSLASGRRALLGGGKGLAVSILPNAAIYGAGEYLKNQRQTELDRLMAENPSFQQSAAKWLATP